MGMWGALPGGPASEGKSLRAVVLEGPHRKEARNGAKTRTSQPGPAAALPATKGAPPYGPRKECSSANGEGSQGRHTLTWGEYNSELLLVFALCHTLIPGFCVPAHGTSGTRGGGGPGGGPACPPTWAEPECEPGPASRPPPAHPSPPLPSPPSCPAPLGRLCCGLGAFKPACSPQQSPLAGQTTCCTDAGS